MKVNTVYSSDRFLVNWLDLKKHNALIAGGAALRWYQNLPVGLSDVDVFFKDSNGFDLLRDKIAALPITEDDVDEVLTVNPASITNQASQWLAKKTKIIFSGAANQAPVPKHQLTYRVICNTKNAITYALTQNDETTKVQLIKTNMYATPQELVSSFDISVCQIATDGMQWYVGKDFVADVKHKKLRMYRFAKSSYKRLIKYWTYGYEPDDQLLAALIADTDVEWVNDCEGTEYGDF